MANLQAQSSAVSTMQYYPQLNPAPSSSYQFTPSSNPKQAQPSPTSVQSSSASTAADPSNEIIRVRSATEILGLAPAAPIFSLDSQKVQSEPTTTIYHAIPGLQSVLAQNSQESPKTNQIVPTLASGNSSTQSEAPQQNGQASQSNQATSKAGNSIMSLI